MNNVSETPVTTHHLFKVFALFIMTIDHIGAYLYPDQFWFRSIGHIASPVWFFLIGHAPQRPVTRDWALWALVLAVLNPFLGAGLLPLNTLVTLAVCRIAIIQVEKREMLDREPLVLILASFLLLLPSFILMEYGSIGFLFALMGYAVRTGKMDWRRGKLVTLAALAMYFSIQNQSHPHTTEQTALFIAGTLVVVYLLSRFKYRKVDSVPRGLRKPIYWLSHHSMQYYVVHRVVLQAIGLTAGILDPTLRLV